jgi:branched-chain amino acid transport system permease protein
MTTFTRAKLVGGIVLLVAAFALPYLASTYYVTLASLILGSALLASSVNMLAGDAGLVSMGHAGIAAASGYGLAWASRQGFELWAQLLVALGMTIFASVLFGLVAMRTRGVFFVMVTLAAGMVFYGVAYRWSDVTGGDNGLSAIRRPPLIGEYWQFYYLVLVVFIIMTVALLVLSRSPFGLVLRGLRDSETRLRSIGYNIVAYKFFAMLLSGFVAGIAGVLLVWQVEFISPTFGDFGASSLLVVMIVLGGLGTVSGPLTGAVVVILIQQVLSTYVDRWSSILGAIFIASVIFAPKGLAEVFRLLGARLGAKTPLVPDQPIETPTK